MEELAKSREVVVKLMGQVRDMTGKTRKTRKTREKRAQQNRKQMTLMHAKT